DSQPLGEITGMVLFLGAVDNLLPGGGRPASSGQLRWCFPAGTPVATLGGLRPIETIQADEQVWSYDLVASQWRPCRVLQTFCSRYQDRSVFVTVAGETIESTFFHPFWVVRGEQLAERPRREHLPLVP